MSRRPRAGGAGGSRAVVMGWGLMRESDCRKRAGDHPLGNRVCFLIAPSTHPRSTRPMSLRDSTGLGPVGKAQGQARPQELDAFLCWACGLHEHARTLVPHARPCHHRCPPLVGGDVDTACTLRLGQYHVSGCEGLGGPHGEASGCIPPLDAVKTLSLEPTGGLRVI